MKLCEACKWGYHNDCGAQVRAASNPCGCEICWGSGGSEAVYARIDANYRRSQEDHAIIVISPNPQTSGNSEGI